MNRLKESENLSQQAGWMLAAAYAVAGKKNIAKEMVANLRTDFSEYTESGRTFGSSTRDKAVALETCAIIDDIPGAMDIAQEVAKAMSGGWYMTQETAFASKAMSSLAGSTPATSPLTSPSPAKPLLSRPRNRSMDSPWTPRAAVRM